MPPLPRTAFDLEPAVLWVLHCAEGPVPRRAAAAIRAMLGKELRPWEVGWEEDFVGIPTRVRTAAARLLGGRREDVALTATTSSGLATVAQGFPWREGDEVLVPLGEFPSNVWPWKSLETRGVRFREVPLWPGQRAGDKAWASAPPPPEVEPEAALLGGIGKRTRLVAASWVRFQDGLRLDLGRLAAGCREADVDLVIDGIQGAGTLPLPLSGLSAFASGGHKGLLAPQGLGLLWTDESFRQRLAPPGGWLSVERATDFSLPSTDHRRRWAKSGERLETGVPNLLGAVALAASLELLNEATMASIAAHIDRLQALLLRALQEVSGWQAEAERLEALRARGRLGSIVSLHHGERGADGLAALLERATAAGIFASVREGYLRIALHGWHDESDLERLLAWLAA